MNERVSRPRVQVHTRPKLNPIQFKRTSMIKATQKNDVTPLCPHCSEAVDEIWFHHLKSVLGRRYLYFCAACHKVLGVSHRKGFWMG